MNKNVLKRRLRFRFRTNRCWYTVLKRKDWKTHKGAWVEYRNHENLWQAIKHLRNSKEFFEQWINK